MVVTFKASFFKELVKLPTATQEMVRIVVEELSKAPTLQATGLDYTKMEGQKKDGNYYRIKIPNYRIGIQYKYPDAVVITIVKRNDMYKVFPPGKRK